MEEKKKVLSTINLSEGSGDILDILSGTSNVNAYIPNVECGVVCKSGCTGGCKDSQKKGGNCNTECKAGCSSGCKTSCSQGKKNG